jgi:hypothetical protein
MAFVGAALVVLSLSPFLSSSVIAQSPMDMMKMMTGGSGENETGNGMMMGRMLGGDDANMSMMPFKMGVLAMPMMCTTPAEMLGMVSGMFGDTLGTDANATEQMMMDMMEQQMMMPADGGFGGMENMTEADMQQALEMVICFPRMDQSMMKGMMDGSG